MAVLTSCPLCAHAFNIPEKSLGSSVRCPRCERPFQARAGNGAARPAPAAVTLPPPPPVLAPPPATASPPAATDPIGWLGFVALLGAAVGLTLLLWPPLRSVSIALAALGAILGGVASRGRSLPNLVAALGGIVLGVVTLVLLVGGGSTPEASPEVPPPPTPSTSVAELRQQLRHEKADVRREAARALGERGAEAAPAVAELAGLLVRDAAPEVRASAADALGRLGAVGRLGCGALQFAGTQSTEPRVRQAALNALPRVGLPTPDDLPALKEALKNDQPGAREQAARTMALLGPQAGPAVEELARTLTDPEGDVREAAALALREMKGAAAPAVLALAKSLTEDERVSVRGYAAEALAEIKPEISQQVIEALVKALGDASPAVQARAALAVATLKERGRPAVPALARALASPDKAVCAQAAYALGKVKAPAGDVAGDLARLAAEGPDRDVRGTALRALWEVGGRPEVPVVLRAIRDAPTPEGRELHLRKLEGYGADLTAHLPELAGLLRDADPQLRYCAVVLLGAAGRGARHTYQVLFRLERNPEEEETVRQAASVALRQVGKPTKQDVEALTAWLRDRDRTPAVLRAGAADALGEIGADARAADGDLAQAVLGDPDIEVREAAAIALGKVKPDPRKALPALSQALKLTQDSHQQLRAYAAEAIVQLGPAAREVVPDLCQVAGDPKAPAEVRMHVMEALGRLVEMVPHTAPDVLKVLTEVLDGPGEADLRTEAAEAMARIVQRVNGPTNADVEKLLGGGPGRLAQWQQAREAAVRAAAKAMTSRTATSVRLAAAAAWMQLGGNGKLDDGVNVILEALRAPGKEAGDAAARVEAAAILGQLSKDLNLRSAVPALQEALKSDDRELAVEAGLALALILERQGASGREGLAVVVDALNQNEEAVRFRAVQALGRAGKSARLAYPMLERLARNDRNEAIRQAAHEALGQVGLPRPTDRDELLLWADPQTKYSTVPCRIAAVEAMGLLKEGEVPIDGLRKVLEKDPAEEPRAYAAFVLTGLGSRAAPAVPELTTCLKATHGPRLRQAAAEALGAIGPAARSALEELRACQRADDEGLRKAAEGAIRKIEAPPKP